MVMVSVQVQRMYALCQKAINDPTFNLKPDIELAVEQTTDGDIYMAFGGSDSIIDWLFNIAATQPMHLGSSTTVSKGFFQLFSKAAPFVEGVIVPNLKTHMTDNSAIYIGGYSQGAAVARLMARQLKRTIKHDIHIITFACPLQGDHRWEENLSKHVASQVNYKNKWDLLSYLPACFAQPKDIKWISDLTMFPHSIEVYDPTHLTSYIAHHRTQR